MTQPNIKFELFSSRNFTGWLAGQNMSLGLTTYQTGKFYLIGLQSNGRLSIFDRTFNRAMGLWSNGQTLYLSTLYQLWRFENALGPGELYRGYDRLYIPQVAYTTGDIDIHDMARDEMGQLIFANTLFSCLSTISETHSFKPLWKPFFISKLGAEDRCHLNGLALREGKAAYVTAVSQSDVADGWRDRRQDGGLVIDVEENHIVCQGLSMPHSPRWYRGRLWVLNSGTGDFGYVDLEKERFVPLTFCPGYLRGLAFSGDYAIIGSSLPRENKTFSGLALDERLAQKNAEPRCGLFIVNLNSGDIVEWVRIGGLARELYDVIVLPGIRRPMALGTKKLEEIRRMLTIEGPAWEG